MKTIEEFYKELTGSEELQRELDIAYVDAFTAFLKKHGCDATAKEFMEYEMSLTEGKISDDDAERAAGGSIVPRFSDRFHRTLPV